MIASYPDDDLTISALATLGEWKPVSRKRPKPRRDDLLAAQVVKKFALLQNYPNPFNPETTLRFTLPKAGRVILKIYDIRGREVATLLDADQPAGTHAINWNSSDRRGREVASGVYFYRLQFKDQVRSGKMILMR